MRIVKCDRCGNVIHGDSNHISVWNEGGETVRASKYGGNDYCDECIAEIEKTIGELPPVDDEGLNLREDSEEEDDGRIFDAIWNIIAPLTDIKDEVDARLAVVITASVDWNDKPSIHVSDIKRVAKIFGAPLEKEDGERITRYSFEIDGVKVYGLEDK